VARPGREQRTAAPSPLCRGSIPTSGAARPLPIRPCKRTVLAHVRRECTSNGYARALSSRRAKTDEMGRQRYGCHDASWAARGHLQTATSDRFGVG
jgi:hypothetical protein